MAVRALAALLGALLAREVVQARSRHLELWQRYFSLYRRAEPYFFWSWMGGCLLLVPAENECRPGLGSSDRERAQI